MEILPNELLKHILTFTDHYEDYYNLMNVFPNMIMLLTEYEKIDIYGRFYNYTRKEMETRKVYEKYTSDLMNKMDEIPEPVIDILMNDQFYECNICKLPSYYHHMMHNLGGATRFIQIVSCPVGQWECILCNKSFYHYDIEKEEHYNKCHPRNNDICKQIRDSSTITPRLQNSQWF